MLLMDIGYHIATRVLVNRELESININQACVLCKASLIVVLTLQFKVDILEVVAP